VLKIRNHWRGDCAGPPHISLPVAKKTQWHATRSTWYYRQTRCKAEAMLQRASSILMAHQEINFYKIFFHFALRGT
jgi:hypothetical protein